MAGNQNCNSTLTQNNCLTPIWTLRALVIIPATIGTLLLLRRLNRWIPVRIHGAEAGMLDMAFDTVLGGAATCFGLFFATVHFFVCKQANLTRTLLVWCCLLMLGFAAFIVFRS
jgi:hypothetical protein